MQDDQNHVTPEERQVRLKKADSIRKMLADTQAGTTRGNFIMLSYAAKTSKVT